MLSIRDIKTIISNLKKIGWEARPNQNFSHFILKSPTGTTMCLHPGDSRRLIKKVLCDFKRIGITKEQLGI